MSGKDLEEKIQEKEKKNLELLEENSKLVVAQKELGFQVEKLSKEKIVIFD